MAGKDAVEIRDNSAAVLKQITGLTKERLVDFAEEMTEVAKDGCPVDTGNLRDSIEWSEEVISEVLIAVLVYTQTGYGFWVNNGTSRMAAQPFLDPAFATARHNILENGGRMD